MRPTLLCISILSFCALSGFAEDKTLEHIHELMSGETIYTLARRYGVTADLLLEYNAIDDPRRIPVGTDIRIPGTYEVAEGDYIYAIARELGIDWQELLAANDLSVNDVLRPGDVLTLPAGSATSSAEIPGSLDGETTATAAEADTIDPDFVEIADATSLELASSETVSSETLIWPHPGEREEWDGRFRGVVMNGEPGDAFQSVTSGVVSLVSPFTSFGKLILVKAENGYLYGYAGADRVDVVQGQRVINGTVLGSVGVSPAFQSARAFFAVWRNNQYIDPESAPRG